eukprot:Blabericola_migrator_1__6704@NODE_338_length_9616_cov_89_769714_g272_i0_p1_GENE_NODE_338_length_9616_cov_89_769714_g272_i0NODE_338_length_9616_cov_89_769714_g272_i0_p1_ORF_typecomplete_len1155_score109_27Redoxin/PF08534_10/6_3e09Redoxin/PF08534_10/5e14Redoxin/PF08534_10/0_0066Redoxin/PF08534_10/14AhpCTSA/PF00578_21/14AhpCTSA/PF00578_21/2_7e05AhpCTSA/PF00578_21/1_9e03AhpCTSA/PF00578_21/43SH3BGR/PF04908_15/7e02SH3BGR/PF04908_15/5_9e02SH3BGR/PF04908_15/0_00063Glutaredoxin/PF00462_24/2_5e03Glutaredo
MYHGHPRWLGCWSNCESPTSPHSSNLHRSHRSTRPGIRASSTEGSVGDEGRGGVVPRLPCNTNGCLNVVLFSESNFFPIMFEQRLPSRVNLFSLSDNTGSTRSFAIPDIVLLRVDNGHKLVSTGCIFADKTIVVFHAPGNADTTNAEAQLFQYEHEYQTLQALGVDEIYCITSQDSSLIKEVYENLQISRTQLLVDDDLEFSHTLTKYGNIPGAALSSRHYAGLIVDGRLVKLFIEEEDPTNLSVSLPGAVSSYLQERLESPPAVVAAAEESGETGVAGKLLVMVTTPGHPEIKEAKRLVSSVGARLQCVYVPLGAAPEVMPSLTRQTTIAPCFFNDGILIGSIDMLRERINLQLELSAQKSVEFHDVDDLVIQLPDVLLDYGDQQLSSIDLLKGKRAVLIGFVGAYTPVCADHHLQAVQAVAHMVKELGRLDDIYIMSTNSASTLKKFCEEYNLKDLRYIPDTNARLTRQLGLDIDLSAMGLGMRCKRFALILDDCIIKTAFVEPDPAAVPVCTSARALMKHLVPSAPHYLLNKITLIGRKNSVEIHEIKRQLKDARLAYKQVTLTDDQYTHLLLATGATTQLGVSASNLDTLGPVLIAKGQYYQSVDALVTALVKDSEGREDSLDSTKYEIEVSELKASPPQASQLPIAQLEKSQPLPELDLYTLQSGNPTALDLKSAIQGRRALILALSGSFASAADRVLLKHLDKAAPTLLRCGLDSIFCAVPDDPYVADHFAATMELNHVQVVSDGNIDLLPRLAGTRNLDEIIRRGVRACLYVHAGIVKEMLEAENLTLQNLVNLVDPLAITPPSMCLLARSGCSEAMAIRQRVNAAGIPLLDLTLPSSEVQSIRESIDPTSKAMVYGDGKPLRGLDAVEEYISSYEKEVQRRVLHQEIVAYEGLERKLLSEEVAVRSFSPGDQIRVMSVKALVTSASRVLLCGIPTAFDYQASAMLCRFEELITHFTEAGVSKVYCICPNEKIVIREYFSQLGVRHISPLCDLSKTLTNLVGATNPETEEVYPYITLFQDGKILVHRVYSPGLPFSPAEDALRALKPTMKIPDSVYLVIKGCCVMCEATEALLRSRCIPYDVLDLPSYKSIKAMNDITGVSEPLPQVYVNGKYIGSYDECKKYVEDRHCPQCPHSILKQTSVASSAK